MALPGSTVIAESCFYRKPGGTTYRIRPSKGLFFISRRKYMKRMLSGIKPTGRLTLGNYIGAIRQFAEYQNDYELFIFIANMHAITVPIACLWTLCLFPATGKRQNPAAW